jgi:hypothetical protein
MKAYVGVDVQIHIFLTSALVGDELVLACCLRNVISCRCLVTTASSRSTIQAFAFHVTLSELTETQINMRHWVLQAHTINPTNPAPPRTFSPCARFWGAMVCMVCITMLPTSQALQGLQATAALETLETHETARNRSKFLKPLETSLSADQNHQNRPGCTVIHRRSSCGGWLTVVVFVNKLKFGVFSI